MIKMELKGSVPDNDFYSIKIDDATQSELESILGYIKDLKNDTLRKKHNSLRQRRSKRPNVLEKKDQRFSQEVKLQSSIFTDIEAIKGATVPGKFFISQSDIFELTNMLKDCSDLLGRGFYNDNFETINMLEKVYLRSDT